MNSVTDRVAVVVQTADGWLRMERPSRIVEAHRPEEVRAAIEASEAAAQQGRGHVVGYVTYEAARAFRLVTAAPGPGPLVWFAIFPDENVRPCDGPRRGRTYELGPLHATVDRAAFDAVFAQIKSHIANGDTYQVNYTFRMRASFEGDAETLFADLTEAQGGHYGVFIQSGDRVLCSASPELFFERRGGRVRARPMKGTVRRGRTLQEDLCRQSELLESPKQRAENVMIVDMVRNDLGRVAHVGTVSVAELFVAERYPNVWQMTSLVEATTDAGLAEIFAAVHPSASVTGAPKVRTMELLAGLERGPRGPYTGAIGHIAPGGNARFNVGIRTAVIDTAARQLEFGVGSGIVWDSEPADEYAECLVKGSVLGRPPVAFELLETMLWTPAGGFFLLERHLQRLLESAEYFGFAVDRAAIGRELEKAMSHGKGEQRVRLLVNRQGMARVERTPLAPPLDPVEVRLATEPVDPADPFLFHKTTNRNVYDRARALAPGAVDVILWNERGEVTESTFANVVVELDGARVTPPVSCGLLAGTFRGELLARGEISERVVPVSELRRARAIWLVNSVQKWRRAMVRP